MTYFQKLVYNPPSESGDTGEARGAGLGVWRRRWRTFVTQVYRVFCHLYIISKYLNTFVTQVYRVFWSCAGSTYYG